MTTALVRTTLLALLGLSAAVGVQAANPAQTGALPVPANAIVGSWELAGSVAPCGTPAPPQPIRALVAFHAGGTVTETNAFPLAGNPSPWGLSARNGPGLGTWSYDPLTNKYTYQLRFYWWVDGVYHGYQQAGSNEITLAPDGLSFEGEIHAERWVYDPNTGTHSKAVDFCGPHGAERFP